MPGAPKIEVGTPCPGSDAGDPLKAVRLLLSLWEQPSPSCCPGSPWGVGGFFLGGIHDHGEQNQSRPPQQPPCSASLYLAGALPRLGFEQMALEVQEADSDLVQRGSVLEPQVTLPELSYRHPKERGMASGHSSLLCAPGARGGLGPNMVLLGMGVCLLPAGEQPGLGRAEAAQSCKGPRHSKEGGPSPHACNLFN